MPIGKIFNNRSWNIVLGSYGTTFTSVYICFYNTCFFTANLWMFYTPNLYQPTKLYFTSVLQKKLKKWFQKLWFYSNMLNNFLPFVLLNQNAAKQNKCCKAICVFFVIGCQLTEKTFTVKFLNFGTPEIFAVNTLKIKLRGSTYRWCKWNSKQWRPWSDCTFRSSLIWVCTVCPDLSVWKLREQDSPFEYMWWMLTRIAQVKRFYFSQKGSNRI